MMTGSQFKARRQALGYSQMQAARGCGVSQSMVCSFEAGRSCIRPSKIEKLATWLANEEAQPRGNRAPAPEPTKAKRRATPPPPVEADPAEVPPGVVDGGELLQHIDAAMQQLQAARGMLAPDEEQASTPVKSREISALAERVAAIEECLIRLGHMR